MKLHGKIESPLSVMLREETAPQHLAAERHPLMQALVRGGATRKDYAVLLLNYLSLYRAIETAIDLNADTSPVLTNLWVDSLRRVPSLEEDLRFFSTENSAQGTCGPHTVEYISHIEGLAKDQPDLIAAHAYVRYLGDLSGGQMIKRVISKTLELSPSQGLSFYEFKGLESVDRVNEVKSNFRLALDAVTDEEIKKLMVAEAISAFKWNVKIFDDVWEARSCT